MVGVFREGVGTDSPSHRFLQLHAGEGSLSRREGSPADGGSPLVVLLIVGEQRDGGPLASLLDPGREGGLPHKGGRLDGDASASPRVQRARHFVIPFI